MAIKAIALLLLPILLLILPSSSFAFNITRILEQYPDFSSYNALLTKTGLANEINGRTTITVLVVDNGALVALNSMPTDLAKRILSVHVILDYYDPPKLNNLKNKVTSVTTLYQTTGDATQFRGFLNITKSETNNPVQFGSATVGSQLNSDLVKSVVAKPYNISVLQVSDIIVPPGIGQSNSPPAPAPPPKKADAPAPSPPSPPPEADVPVADAPVADAPAADAPNTVSAPVPALADAPNAKKKVADKVADAPVSRSTGQVAASASFGVVMLMAAAAMLGL